MFTTYPAKYRDKFGEETTTIDNDGRTLRMVVRGVEFAGRSFGEFEPSAHVGKSRLESFSFFLDALCSCEIECDIPIWVVDRGDTLRGTLRVYLELGEPDESRGVGMIRIKEDRSALSDNRALNREALRLELICKDRVFSSKGENLYDSFDEQLTELVALLPTDFYLKVCWTCAFSDYHWSGSGSFGHLACFRNTKEQYLRARTRNDLRTLWDKRAENVQEIHLCPEYKRRQPGSGLYIGEEYPGKRG